MNMRSAAALGRAVLCLTFYKLICMLCAAQTQPGASAGAMPASAYKLISVKVSGSQRFTSGEIALASGLPVGTIAHDEDFKKAARQLGESGAFSNISYTYSFSPDGTKLEFQVTDTDKFVPARFLDFVWYSDKELRAKIHEHVPLFKGDLPTSGRLPDEVSDVVQALLVENGVPGQVEYARTNGRDGHIEAIDYNVVGVSIRIHGATFPGAGTAELPLLQAAAEKLTDREYSTAYMNNFIEHAVLPMYRERGYLKAACAHAEPKVVKLAAANYEHQPPPTFVDVTFPVTPGIAYKVSGWQWSENKQFSTDVLQKLIHLKSGETANAVQLEDDLHSVRDLYGTRGYILASIKVDAAFDDAAQTVAYRLTVDENSQFRMGELEFRGLDNLLTAKLRSEWKIRPGEVYDASYLKQFIVEANKLLPPTLDWVVDPHVTAIATEKIVDVDLQYTAKATR